MFYQGSDSFGKSCLSDFTKSVLIKKESTGQRTIKPNIRKGGESTARVLHS